MRKLSEEEILKTAQELGLPFGVRAYIYPSDLVRFAEHFYQKGKEEPAPGTLDLIKEAAKLSARRVRICQQAPKCPRCRADQVQIVDSNPLASWKCRECRHTWRHEPLIVIKDPR